MEIYLVCGGQMNMKEIERMIDFMLKNANPSIVYRVKKEILQNISEEEEKQLQEQIMSEKLQPDL